MRTTAWRVVAWLCAFSGAILLPCVGWAANLNVDCSGATPGAFASLQAAIDSLDVIGPHQITLAPQTCQENVQIVNRQRLTIVSPNGTFISSAAGPASAAMTISGSTGIVFVRIGFRGGLQGVLINRSSEVAIHGTTIDGNSGPGVSISQNSFAQLDGLVQDNGGPGVNVFGSLVATSSLRILKNGGAGIHLVRSRASIDGTDGGNVIQGNSNGVYLENGASADFTAPNAVQSNLNSGVVVTAGSSAEFFGSVDSNGAPVPNVISGNPLIGLDISSGAVQLTGANEISNNGSGLQLLHAGVRVDLNASLITAGSGNIMITGNTGPGVEATTGGNVLLAGTVVTKNSGYGVRLRGNGRIVILPPNTNALSGNGGASIKCDGTSLYVGDPKGLPEESGCTFVPVTNQ